MKILSLNSGNNPGHEFVTTNLHASTPFGYDLILVNPASTQSLYGTNSPSSVNSRWLDAVKRWSNGKRKIIVFMDQLSLSDLDWLPIEEESLITLSGLESVGRSNYVGNVVSTDPTIRHFMTQNRPHFRVNTYLRYENPDPRITVHSSVDESLITAFTYRSDLVEIVFIPLLSMEYLVGLINTLDQPINSWGITPGAEINEKISVIDTRINELYASRDTLSQELNALNDSVSSAIDADVYLTRAIGHFDATKATEHPSPESFYGAIEAIENAFNSEREMQETLGLSKSFINKVMRRANEFRHEAKNGQAPTPLTAEEISDLSSRVNTVISGYIQYVLNIE